MEENWRALAAYLENFRMWKRAIGDWSHEKIEGRNRRWIFGKTALTLYPSLKESRSIAATAVPPADGLRSAGHA